MSLVVPILRLVLLFFNVWETFKTLKPPRVSSRTGEPSENAKKERKRNMKGCMASWVVWVVYTIAERIADSILGIFVPFYSEFKVFFLIFLLVARARGAEPLFMYFIRPMIRPYTPMLEWVFTQSNVVGDFVALIIFFPTAALIQWWNPSSAPPTFHFGPTEEELKEIEAHTIALEAEAQLRRLQRKASRRSLSGTGTLRKKPSFVANRRVASGNEPRPKLYATKITHGRSVSGGDYRATSTGRPSMRDANAGTASHRIWMPPPSAFADDDQGIPDPTPDDETPVLTPPGSEGGNPDIVGEVELELDDQMEQDYTDEKDENRIEIEYDEEAEDEYPTAPHPPAMSFTRHSNLSQRRIRSVSEHDLLRPEDVPVTEFGHFEPYAGASRPPSIHSQSLPYRAKGRRAVQRLSERMTVEMIAAEEQEDENVDDEMDVEVDEETRKRSIDAVVDREEAVTLNEARVLARPTLRTHAKGVTTTANRLSMMSTRTNSGSTTMTGYTSLRTSMAISSSQSGSGSDKSSASRGRRRDVVSKRDLTVNTNVIGRVPAVVNTRTVAAKARAGAPKESETLETSEGEDVPNTGRVPIKKKRKVVPRVVRNLSSASESYGRATVTRTSRPGQTKA